MLDHITDACVASKETVKAIVHTDPVRIVDYTRFHFTHFQIVKRIHLKITHDTIDLQLYGLLAILLIIFYLCRGIIYAI